VQPFLLVSDGQVLTLRVLRGEDLVVLETETLPAPIAPFPHRSEAYDACVLDWCIRYGIELVHYQHLAFHSHGAPGLFRRLGIRRILSLHDFYMVCPTVKLIDNTERFCAGLCTPSDGSCTYDLWKGDGLPDLKHAAIMDWTAMSSAVMSEFDALVTTSDRARDLILARLPATRRLPFHVIPHGRDFPRFLPPAQEPFRGGKLRILVPGNVNLAKGGMLIRQIAARMQDEVEFHLLGKIGHSVGKVPGLVKHGAYERDTFVDRVAAIEGGVHVGAILSIWPETYCHTLTELWAAGLPVVGIDLGAVGERIAETGAGWLVPEPDVEAAIGVFRQILENPDALLQRAEAVGRWQATLGSERSTDWMAKRYLDIYRGLSG
jgi:glycosyltransferase involved in cell wall biosynthesis